MKQIKYFIIVLFLIPVIMSCKKVSGQIITLEREEIHFSQEGGSEEVRVVKGDFSEISIGPISGTDYPPYEGDGEEYLKLDWIEVTKITSDKTISIMISVSPNVSGESRYAQVSVHSLDRGAIIKVYQN